MKPGSKKLLFQGMTKGQLGAAEFTEQRLTDLQMYMVHFSVFFSFEHRRQ
jgi:hypothetical protein